MARQPNTSLATTDPSPDAQVRAQLIAVLYARARSGIYSNFAAALLAAFLLIDKAPLVWLAAWVALLILFTIARLMLVERYHRGKPSVEAALRWGRYYAALTTAGSALMWSIGALAVLILLPPDPVVSMFIATIFTGFAVGSVLAFSSYLPAFYSYIIPLSLSIALGFMFQADKLHIVLAGLVTIFTLLMLVFARNSHRTLTDSIALRFENIHLIQELQQKKAEAEAANIAKSKFLAAASHDLRQPLHALRIFGELIHDSAETDPKRKLIADGITDSIQALEGLLNALLDLSQLDARVLRPTFTHASLAPMFNRLRVEFGMQARAKGLSFRIVACRHIVVTDATMLERILRNLLSNALHYTDAGGIVMGVRHRGEQLSIEVYDTGCGIPADQVDRIFDEFYQVGNPERDRAKGLGLGLTIVQRLAGMLDHSVTVKSVVSQGSCFAIGVPRGDATQVAPERAAVPADNFNLSDVCVLVIDDEPSVRNAMTEMLLRWNCNAVVVDTEDEALRQLRRLNITPDIVLTDYRLRERRTGMQAIERLRSAYNKAIPAVIMTGDTAVERLREAAAGGYTLLHKPVAPAKLRVLIAAVLEMTRR